MCRWFSEFSHGGSVTGHSANLPEHTQVCSCGTVRWGEGRGLGGFLWQQTLVPHVSGSWGSALCTTRKWSLGNPKGFLITKEIKSKVDGRVVLFWAMPQVNASSLLTSLYGAGYEAWFGFLGVVCLFVFVTECFVWSVCLLLIVGWFLYSTGLSGRSLFENTFLGLSRSFYMYISEGRIYTVPRLEKLLDKK